MVELISLTCPNCSATMQIENNRKEAYCTYCGTKMLVHNSNEKVVHHIDHAAMAMVDAQLEVELQRMKMVADERRRQDEKEKKDSIISTIIGLPIFLFFAWFLWNMISLYLSK